MEEDGLSVDDVFSQCVFQQDERDMLLKAIRIVKPDYHPSVSNMHTNQCYSSLIQDFYTQVLQSRRTFNGQLAHGKLDDPPFLLMST